MPQVEVAAGDEAAALVFRIMQAPMPRTTAIKLEEFAARHGVQIYLQPGGLDTIRPLSGLEARTARLRASMAAGQPRVRPLRFHPSQP